MTITRPPLISTRPLHADDPEALFEEARARQRRRRLRLAAVLIAMAIAAGIAYGIEHTVTGAGHTIGHVPSGAVAGPGTTVALGAAPLALTLGAGSLWVLAESNAGAVVLRLDRHTGARLAVFPVGAPGPDIGAISYAQGHVWAVAGMNLLRIDPGRPAAVARTRLPGLASGVAIGAGAVWATTIGQEHDLVVRLNPRSLAITARIDLPTGSSSIVTPTPGVIAFASVWVADGDSLLGIDPLTDRVSAQRPLAPPPTDLAYAGGRIWALAGLTVTAFDRRGKITASIALPVASARLAINGNRLWVTDNCGCRRGTVMEVDLQSRQVIARRATGETPVAILADRGTVWIANFGSSTLSRFLTS